MGSAARAGASWLRGTVTRVSTLLGSSSPEQTRRRTTRRADPAWQGDDTFEIVWVGDILLADAASAQPRTRTATPGRSPIYDH